MRKIALLFTAIVAGLSAQAQLTLSGTTYTQNFDNLANGLPMGWTVRIKASATSLGIDSSNGLIASPTATGASWTSSTGGFKNVASADGYTGNFTTPFSVQQTATDRSLGIRQVGQTSATFPSDTGAAFTLQIANTTNLSNFTVSFKLQSLDSSSPRISTWRLEYGFGANPTSFTQVTTTPGTLTTGGNTWSNTTVTASFGNALDNNAGPVWIRIVNLTGTSGTGNRPTTAIDDFTLNWSGAAAANYKPMVTALSPLDNSTNVALGSNLTITFDRGISKGSGSIYVKNETAQTTQTIPASSSNVTVSGHTATITGVTLALGSAYHVTFDSTAFDTLTYHSYGIYDTTDWNFATPAAAATTLNENFDASCGATPSNLPANWTRYSVTGAQIWNCNANGNNSTPGVQINGYASGQNNDNEDWLISPQLNLSAMMTAYLRFDEWKRFTGTELSVLVSHDYTGAGNPTSANWTPITIAMSPADTGVWKTYEANISGAVSQPLYIAFKYISTTSDAYQLRLDNVLVSQFSTGITNFSKANLQFAVVGTATANTITLAYNMEHAGKYTVSIYDLAGREVYNTTLNVEAGKQRTDLSGLNLTSGLYLVKMSNGTSFGVAKALVQ